MPKFRKKPVVIEAEQWNPAAGLAREVCSSGGPVRPTTYREVASLLGTSGCSREEPHWDWAVMGVVETISGPHVICPGDYVVPEPDGLNYYPCRRDVFEATYEPV